MRIEHDVIDRSAEEGARVVALALLAAADEEAARLATNADGEALHDFRVALRRLRTALRSFRSWLDDDVKPRVVKRLKRCARATNAARDAEVHLAWLREKGETLARRQRHGVDFLNERLQAQVKDAASLTRVADRYRRASTRLSRRLRTYQRKVDAGGEDAGPSFGGVLASLITEQLDGMSRRLEAVSGPLDEETIHKARIEAKRLRYLLEPLRGNRHADSRDAVEHLKRLQDVLGELHDSHVLAGEVRDAMIAAAAERARELYRAVYERGGGAALRGTGREGARAGLVAIARKVRERRDALFADLDREWRMGGVEVLAAEIQAVVAALEARAGGKIERERKYLLTAVPPRAAEVHAIEILQGWLPGARLRERIRRIGDESGERFWRGLKQGVGRVKLQAEEETTREVFDTLWPLTQGRRIAKRRYKVKEAGLTWEIDEFLDRELVIAEVELPAGRAEVVLPDWIRPLVARDVSDDPAFLNESLAVAPPSSLSASAASDAATAAAAEHPAPPVLTVEPQPAVAPGDAIPDVPPPGHGA